MKSELVAILEKEAEAECQRVLAEARTNGAQITDDAQKDAQAIMEAAGRQVETERRAARMQAESAAAVRAAALVLQAKDQALAEVFARSEEELAQVLKSRQRYASLLRGLLKEAAGELGGKLVVLVHPHDLELAHPIIRELRLDAEVKAVPDVSGGVRLSTGDGRFVVENTLSSRLARVKSTLVTDVAALLWGQ